MTEQPHQNQPVLTIGEPLARARTAMIMIHGRGASAEDILTLTGALPRNRFSFLAPQAANHIWYPERFTAPIEHNEPYLSSALTVIGDLLAHIEEAGIPPEKTILLGFSQGACLVLEYAARNARRYGGVAGLSGGLIGPDGTSHAYDGSLEGTPVLIGCSDIDPHIPLARVHLTANMMRRLDALVIERIYPNMDHTINEDELSYVRDWMEVM